MYIYIYTHSFYGEGIFLTVCTSKPTNSKSLFSIICHVLLHFLFLYYTFSVLELILYFTCSSIMETLAFHKSRLGEKLLTFLSILLYI